MGIVALRVTLATVVVLGFAAFAIIDAVALPSSTRPAAVASAVLAAAAGIAVALLVRRLDWRLRRAVAPDTMARFDGPAGFLVVLAGGCAAGVATSPAVEPALLLGAAVMMAALTRLYRQGGALRRE